MCCNRFKRFYPRRLGAAGLFFMSTLLIMNCASEAPELKSTPTNPITLRVENNSSKVIDVIQAKPCGTDNRQFKPQMNAIKPKERIMLQIYEECVDLVALDGFGNVLDELVGLRMNANITWKIQDTLY